MFKVICIDGSKREYSDNSDMVVEGNTYEVTDSWRGVFTGQPYYSIVGFDCRRGYVGFRQDRFAPLSSIDETEMKREYNHEPATNIF